MSANKAIYTKKVLNIMPITQKQRENLAKGTKFSENTPEKQRQIASMGGIASGEAKRRKKSIKECAALFGELACDEATKKLLEKQGIKDADDLTHNMAVVYSLFGAVMRGNANAARVLLELTENIKSQQTNVTVNNNNPYAKLTDEELKKLANEK